MDIYIKNLHPNLDEDDLKVLFEPFGAVISTTVVRDRESGMSRGFGFVKMHHAIDAQRAIDDLNGRSVASRTLLVSEAVPKDERRITRQAVGDEREFENQRFTKTKSSFEEDGWVSVKFERTEEDDEPDEEISLEVQDEAEFTKSVSSDGLISISFKS